MLNIVVHTVFLSFSLLHSIASRFWLAILLPVLVYLFLYPLTFVVLFGCCPHL